MSGPLAVAKATFQDVTARGEAWAVHFNPATLQLTLQNTLREEGQGAQKTQYVAGSSAKLTMELVFDTTDTGSDVRAATGRVAALMRPSAQGGKGAGQAVPPVVLFAWGSFSFQGICESYRETIEFFSHDGVPLRATVSLTLAKQDLVFSRPGDGAGNTAVRDDTLVVQGDDVQLAVSLAGSPGLGRAAAAANGLESMRFSTGPIALSASVQLGGPVAFASGGAGAGLSLGASAGLSAGASFGASASVTSGAAAGVAGAGLAVTGPAFGGSASAGRLATEGAFAGLRAPSTEAGASLDLSRLTPRGDVRAAGLEGGVAVGGRARVDGPASLGTDVGAGAAVSGRAWLGFES